MSRNFLLSFIIILISLLLSINFLKGIVSLLKKDDLLKQAEQRLAEERLKNDDLKRKLAEIQDPEYIERQAREKLNLGKEKEVVIILPPISQESEKESEVQKAPNWQKWLKLYW